MEKKLETVISMLLQSVKSIIASATAAGPATEELLLFLLLLLLLGGSWDLVSRLINPIIHIITLLVPIINLLTKSP